MAACAMAARTSLGKSGRRRFLDDLLMAALHGAIAIEERRRCRRARRRTPAPRRAARSGSSAPARAGRRRTPCAPGASRTRPRPPPRRPHARTCMPLPPPPALALMISGKPTRSRLGHEPLQRLFGAVIAGRHRHADRRHRRLRGALRAHGADRGRRRPDEHQSCIEAGLCELGVFREKTVARMHRVGTHLHGKLDQPALIEIALPAGEAPRW